MPQRHFIFLGAPHPATHCVFSMLREMLSDHDVTCVLRTSDREDGGEIGERIFLRAEATDAVALIAAPGLLEGEPLEACRLVARLESLWRHLPTIPVQAALTQPFHTLAALPAPLPTISCDRLAALLPAREAAMREAAALCCHPLAYFRAIDCTGEREPIPRPPSAAQTTEILAAGGFSWTFVSGPAHRRTPGAEVARTVGEASALIVAADLGTAVSCFDGGGMALVAGLAVGANPVSRPYGTGGAIRMLSAVADAERSLPEVSVQFDHVHLHHLAEHRELSRISGWALARLAPHGLVSGREASAAAAQRLVAKLMQDHAMPDCTFVFRDEAWTGVRSTAWSA